MASHDSPPSSFLHLCDLPASIHSPLLQPSYVASPLHFHHLITRLRPEASKNVNFVKSIEQHLRENRFKRSQAINSRKVPLLQLPRFRLLPAWRRMILPSERLESVRTERNITDGDWRPNKVSSLIDLEPIAKDKDACEQPRRLNVDERKTRYF